MIKHRIFASVIAIVVLLPAYAIQASETGWNPKRGATQEAAIIGNWRGELLGEPIEIALWPSPEFVRLTGVMKWRSCTTAINFLWGVRDILANPKPAFPYAELENNTFSLSVLPAKFISRQTKSNFSFDKNQCPQDGYPDIFKNNKFFFVANDSFTTLTPYSFKNGESAIKKRDDLALVRKKPDSAFLSSITQLSALSIYKMDQSADTVVRNPEKRYLDVLNNVRIVVNGVDINNPEPIKAAKKDWYYFKDHYDSEFAKLLVYILWGNFDEATDELYYYHFYPLIMEAYGNKCKAYISEFSTIKHTVQSTTQKEHSNPEYTNYQALIKIDARFEDSFLVAHKRKLSVSRIASSELTYLTAEPDFFYYFFDNEKCDSLVTLRFLENYHRSILGQQPLKN